MRNWARAECVSWGAAQLQTRGGFWGPPLFCLSPTCSGCCIVHPLPKIPWQHLCLILPFLFSLCRDAPSLAHPLHAGVPQEDLCCSSWVTRTAHLVGSHAWELPVFAALGALLLPSRPTEPSTWSGEFPQHDQGWPLHLAIQTCSSHFAGIWELSPDPPWPPSPSPHKWINTSCRSFFPSTSGLKCPPSFPLPAAQTHHLVFLDSAASLIIITPVASPRPARPALYHSPGVIFLLIRSAHYPA